MLDSGSNETVLDATNRETFKVCQYRHINCRQLCKYSRSQILKAMCRQAVNGAAANNATEDLSQVGSGGVKGIYQDDYLKTGTPMTGLWR